MLIHSKSKYKCTYFPLPFTPSVPPKSPPPIYSMYQPLKLRVPSSLIFIAK